MSDLKREMESVTGKIARLSVELAEAREESAKRLVRIRNMRRREAEDSAAWKERHAEIKQAKERASQAHAAGERKGIERAAKACDGHGVEGALAAKLIRALEVPDA